MVAPTTLQISLFFIQILWLILLLWCYTYFIITTIYHRWKPESNEKKMTACLENSSASVDGESPAVVFTLKLVGSVRICRGSATQMKMGGGGRGPGGSEARIFSIPKTENSADLAHYFPENGGIIPRTLKNGGTRPPRPPCGGAPVNLLLLVSS